jgi:hypothetical protein
MTIRPSHFVCAETVKCFHARSQEAAELDGLQPPTRETDSGPVPHGSNRATEPSRRVLEGKKLFMSQVNHFCFLRHPFLTRPQS